MATNEDLRTEHGEDRTAAAAAGGLGDGYWVPVATPASDESWLWAAGQPARTSSPAGSAPPVHPARPAPSGAPPDGAGFVPVTGPLARPGAAGWSGSPPLVLKARPRDNGLGAVGIALGAIALLLALFFPYVPLPIGFLTIGALGCGWSALRHSVNTGAPGKNRAITALILGVLAVVAIMMNLVAASRQVQETTSTIGGIGAMLDGATRAEELRSLELGGTGNGTVTLDGVPFTFTLRTCGLDNPVPGYRLGGHGQGDAGGRAIDVTFGSVAVGAAGDGVTVDVGGTLYLLEGEELFEVADGTVTARGGFKPLFGQEVPGEFRATCSR